MIRFAAAVCLVAVASLAHAERAEKFGTLEVHYNAISTADLSPEVARAYKIDRSKTRGLVTLSVIRSKGAGMGDPLPAKVNVRLVNQTQQLAEVPMREVRDGKAIYYLGEFRIAPPDTLRFTASVATAGEPTREVKFEQKFYK